MTFKGGSRGISVSSCVVKECKHTAVQFGGTTGKTWLGQDYECAESVLSRSFLSHSTGLSVGGLVKLQGARDCKVVRNYIEKGGVYLVNGGTPGKEQTRTSGSVVSENICVFDGNDAVVWCCDSTASFTGNRYCADFHHSRFKLNNHYMGPDAWRLAVAEAGSVFHQL